jgi:predicted ribosomally synthesized peptide with SipW-like signal peptide
MSRTRENAPRHASEHRAARRPAGRPARRRSAPRHSAGASRSRARTALGARGLLSASGILAIGTVVVLSGTGGTFALWSQSSAVAGPTISSGSTGLTINGETDHALSELRLATLTPGASALAPLMLRNTGTTTLGVRVAGTDVTAEANGLSSSLRVSVTPSASCVPGLPGAQNAALAGFATSSPLASFGAGDELAVCLEVRLDPAAPASVQGGSADFVLTFEATQERTR